MTAGPPKPPRTPPPRPVRALVLAALVLWLASLALPAIYYAREPTPTPGFWFMLLGLALGWKVVGGWAAYANPLLLVAALRLWRGGRPRWMTLAMLVLMADMALYRGEPVPDAFERSSILVGWGWGAIAWVAAGVLLAIATAVRERWLLARGMRIALGAAALGVAAIGVVSLRQHQAASAYERASAMFAGIAVMPDGPCGIEYRWPEKLAPLIPPGQTLRLDLDRDARALMDEEALQRWQLDGHDWERLAEKQWIAVALRLPPRATRYSLRLRPDDDLRLHLRLVDDQRPAPLFDQPLRRIPSPGGGDRYCPMPRRDLDLPERAPKVRSPATLLHTALRLAGQDHRDAPRPQPPSADALTTPCPVDPRPVDGDPDLHLWDGREVRFLHHPSELPRAVCSAEHAALVELGDADVDTGGADGRQLWVAVTVQVHDRNGLHAQLHAYGLHACLKPQCDRRAPDFIQGVRFDDKTVTVATAAGDWTFPR